MREINAKLGYQPLPARVELEKPLLHSNRTGKTRGLALPAWVLNPTLRIQSAPSFSWPRPSPSSPRCTSSATRSSWPHGRAGNLGTGAPASTPRLPKRNAREGSGGNRKREARASLFFSRANRLFGGGGLAEHARFLAADLAPDLRPARFAEEECANHDGHERDGDHVREPEVRVPVRIVRCVELA